MALYDYKCPDCGETKTITHSVTSNSVYHCDKCGTELRKVYGIGGIQFKGEGWGHQ